MLRKVLIADDAASHRRIVAAALRALPDIEIIVTENGREAIDEAIKQEPDLVVLDLAMPEVNGAEAAIALKRLRPTLPVILLTLYGPDIGQSLASAVGVDLVLSKTDGLEKLVSTVTHLLHVGPVTR